MRSISYALILTASVLLKSTYAAPLIARSENNEVSASDPFPSSKSIKLPISQRKWRTGKKGLEKRQSNSSNADDNEAELLNWQDARYILTVDLAGQEVDLVIDTGSSE